MSYCYDIMSKAWATLEQELPQAVREGELAMRFGFLIEEMHEANHRLKDAINHDARVSKCARKLDEVMSRPKESDLVIGQCPECLAINNHESGCSRRKGA